MSDADLEQHPVKLSEKEIGACVFAAGVLVGHGEMEVAEIVRGFVNRAAYETDGPYHCGYHESLTAIGAALGLQPHHAHADIAERAIAIVRRNGTAIGRMIAWYQGAGDPNEIRAAPSLVLSWINLLRGTGK
jgi:hypothetical protein